MELSKPIRIQIKRTKGFNLQAQSPDGRPVVSVCRPWKWGNPISVEKAGNGLYKNYPFKVVEKHKDSYIHHVFLCKSYKEAIDLLFTKYSFFTDKNKDTIKTELKGKHLACWCPLGSPCHADVLLQIANEE